jgi:hypothetical protein
VGVRDRIGRERPLLARKADDDHRSGLVIRLFAIDTYPALFDHAIGKQRKIRNDFSVRVTWRLSCEDQIELGWLSNWTSHRLSLGENRLVNVRLVVADSTECVEIRAPSTREWLSRINRNLQCLGADFLDEPFFQPNEFGGGFDLVGPWMR